MTRSLLPRRAPAALATAAVLAGSAALLVAAGLAGPAAARTPAGTAPTVDYELPFTCGQVWTGSTRPGHSPSPLALDFTRARDYGQPVLAAAAGTVTRVADLGNTSYGRYVVIDHGNGNSTLYAHLEAVWVAAGEQVDQGSIIGQVGDTGNATGPHLHFEEQVDGADRPAWFHGAAYVPGTPLASSDCPDVPLSADRNADGTDTVGIFRHNPRRGVFRFAVPGAAPEAVWFGGGRDLPVTGDWDGDGTTDVGVRRQGTRRFLLRNGDGTTTRIRLGLRPDRPVTGDWDGDGRTDVGVFRPATATFLLRDGTGSVSTVQLGSAGSIPVTGDWNGDGVTDVGVFDPAMAMFTLRVAYSDGSVTTTTVPFGAVSDLPVAGDWNGDGITDIGTWDPATATFELRLAPATSRSTSAVTTVRFGRHR